MEEKNLSKKQENLLKILRKEIRHMGCLVIVNFIMLLLIFLFAKIW